MTSLPLKDKLLIRVSMLKVVYPKIKLPKYISSKLNPGVGTYPSNIDIRRFLATQGSHEISSYLRKEVCKLGRGTSLRSFAIWTEVPLTITYTEDGYELNPHTVAVYEWINEFCYKFGKPLPKLDITQCIDFDVADI